MLTRERIEIHTTDGPNVTIAYSERYIENCPFCQETLVRVICVCYSSPRIIEGFVECQCGVHGPTFYAVTSEAAVAGALGRWNLRRQSK